MGVSVLDLLQYDELPDEVKAICEKQIEHRIGAREDEYEKAYEEGRSSAFEEGKAAGYETGYADGKRDGLADAKAAAGTKITPDIAPIDPSQLSVKRPPTQQSGGA